MTHVSMRTPHNTGAIGGGIAEADLWAVLPEQHQDAKELLENPAHEVATPLSESEMADMRAKTDINVGFNLSRALNGAAIALCLVIVSVIIWLISSQ